MRVAWQETVLADGWHLRLVAILREDVRYRDGTCIWHMVRWPDTRIVIVEPPRPVPPELPEPWLSAVGRENLTYLGWCCLIGTFFYLLMRIGVI